MRNILRAVAVGIVIGAVAAPAAHAVELEVGQMAPDFSLPDQTGKIHHLADYRGKTVILAMYPKDMTPG